MIRLATEVLVRGVTAREVCDFMIECEDDRYHAWWPEGHFKVPHDETRTRHPRERRLFRRDCAEWVVSWIRSCACT